MKKLFLITLLISLPLISHANIIINEIMYDLPEPGVDEGHEWIEVRNDGPARTLSSHRLFEDGTSHGIAHIQGGDIMLTGEYAVIADDSSQFLIDYPSYSGRLFDSSWNSLSNDGETISITLSDFTTDTVTYASSTGATGDGNSLQRQTDDTWLATTPTPGVANIIESASSSPTVSISGIISADTTWSPGEGVYILENTVTVSASTTLTIEPGTIVKARHGGAGILVVEGNLVATGMAENKIYFTSLLDDSLGGDSDGIEGAVGAVKDWRGIHFKPGSSGNLNYVTLRYAGYVGAGAQSGIENEGGTIQINHSTITDNYIRGIYNGSGTIIVADSVLQNQQYGIQVMAGDVTINNSTITNNSIFGFDAYGVNSLTLLNNNFSNNTKTGRVGAGAIFNHSGNTSYDTTNRGFEITGIVQGDVSWHSSDLPLIIADSNIVWIGASSTLNISPGSIIKFGTAGQMIVEGSLVINGTESAKVYLTSLKDDSIGGDTNNDGVVSAPAPMDWNGVEFKSGSTGNISYAVMQYAGGFNGISRAVIYNLGGDLTFNNIKFFNNYANDIYQNAGSAVITHSQFSTSTTYAIFNAGTDVVDARENWWGSNAGPTIPSQPIGPNPRITENVLYEPWIGRDPSLPNPVIIVPGILSSQLVNAVNSEVWPAGVLLLSPLDLHLNQLSLLEDGVTPSSDIQVGNLIDSIGDSDFFLGLSNLIESQGYQENSDLFMFPYDWRLDLQILALGLKEKIEQIKVLTGAEKVDLVAHSMGGLLVKKYLKDYGGDSVDVFLDIGTPHTGSPKAFKILNYGDNLDATFFFKLLGLDGDRVKIISQNMPSIYQLLPSRNYFDDTQYYVSDMTNGTNRLDYEETKDYLKSQGRNNTLVDRADEFHQEIDNLNPADYGVRTYNFVGCGTPTIGQFYILEDGVHPIYNIRMINGDGTVPLKSAEAITASSTYYVRSAQHAIMPSTSGVRDLIAEILTSTSTQSLDISAYSNIATDSTGCTIPDGRIVSFHSPIDLHIYDSSGNHAGPDGNGDIENDISGVVYEVIDGNKFAYLPVGTDYTVKGSATSEGSFDARIQEVVDGEVATTTIFADIPLSSTTQAQFDLNSNIPSQIYLDSGNDGVFESSYVVSTTTQGFLESTGKISVIVETAVTETSDRANSKPAVQSREQEATSSPEVLGVATTTPIIETAPVAAVSQLPLSGEEENVIEKPATENTATVYKSLTQKVGGVFKKLWSWIKSRL